MNYILKYYQAIQDGSITVGKWIKLWYEYIVRGLEGSLFFYDSKKATHAINFIERYCRHHEGSLAPNLIKLELWQKAFISVVFGIVDKDGTRQFREIVMIIGRKNGKTLLAAAVAAYCLYLDGEYGARIYMAAPKLEQASLCFDAFYQMVLKEPQLSGLTKKRRSDVYVQSTNSSAKPLAFSAKKSDGLNISLGICDEIASWQADQGLKFYDVLKSSMGARKAPILLSISTAGYVSDGVYDELVKRSTAVLLGTSKETKLAPFLYMIDNVDKWNDINELQKSNPNLGVSVSIDYMLEEINIAESSLPKKTEFLTKYCNIKQNSTAAWLPMKVVENCCSGELTLESLRHNYAVVGIDLSQTTDLTAAVVIVEKKGVLNVVAHFWLPAERIDDLAERDGVPYRIFQKQGYLSASGDNFVEYTDVYNWIINLVKQYEILPLQIGYDRYSSTYLIQQLKADGLKCDDVFQGENLTPVIQECEGLMRDGKINIGNNNLLKSHFLNSALKINKETRRMRLVKLEQRQHIDGMAALLDALTVRQKWHSIIGEQLKNERSD